MQKKTYRYFYLLVGFLFLAIVSVNLFSDGMFVDGLQYAAISRNMAEGIGTFWKPHLSNTLFNEFYEHPPLALGLQSLAFRIFGDSIMVERFYSLFTFVVVALLMVAIWGKLTSDYSTGWLPIAIWILIRDVSWAAANNILENTMAVFVCLALLLYLTALNKKGMLWLILSGLSLSLAVLTKGFVCLYIWVAPFFVWLFLRKSGILVMIKETLIMVAFTIIPLLVLFIWVPEAKHNMLQYFDVQVLRSIQSIQTVGSRFAIVRMLFENIAVPGILIVFLCCLAARKNKVSFDNLRKNAPCALTMFSLVLSGVLPMMVSLKQSAFYILTVYPLFSVGLACLMLPIYKPFLSAVDFNLRWLTGLRLATIIVAVVSIALSAAQVGRVGRDREMIADCKAVIEVVGKHTTINICNELFDVWSLHGYFARYGDVSLESNPTEEYKYYLISENCILPLNGKGYENVPINTSKYHLYLTTP